MSCDIHRYLFPFRGVCLFLLNVRLNGTTFERAIFCIFGGRLYQSLRTEADRQSDRLFSPPRSISSTHASKLSNFEGGVECRVTYIGTSYFILTECLTV